MKIIGAMILALLVFIAVMITAYNFCPPEHLVQESFKEIFKDAR